MHKRFRSLPFASHLFGSTDTVMISQRVSKVGVTKCHTAACCPIAVAACCCNISSSYLKMSKCCSLAVNFFETTLRRPPAVLTSLAVLMFFGNLMCASKFLAGALSHEVCAFRPSFVSCGAWRQRPQLDLVLCGLPCDLRISEDSASGCSFTKKCLGIKSQYLSYISYSIMLSSHFNALSVM